MIRFLLVLGLMTLGQGYAFATTYYIDTSGNDTGDGRSPATAWQSLARVNATTFLPGDTLLFRAGETWSGQLQPQGSGSTGAPIVIDSYGNGAKPKIAGPGTNGSAGLLLHNLSYWEVNDLEVTNTVPGGDSNQVTGILVNNTLADSAMLDHVYIRNCYVHDVNAPVVGNSNYNKGTGGIIFTGYISDVLVKGCRIDSVTVEGLRNSSSLLCARVVFDSNTITNVYGDGIVLHGVDSGSSITRNTAYNVCISSAANFAAMWTYLSDHSLIAYNEVYGTQGGYIDGESFDADISTNGDVFEYNYSHDNARGFMLFMPNAANIVVRYNLSINDCTGGSKMFNYTPTGYANNQIYNNSFYLSHPVTDFFMGGFFGTFNNNIVYSTSTVGAFAQQVTGSSCVFRNNCFYPASVVAVNGPSGTVSGNNSLDPLWPDPGYDAAGMSSPETAYSLPPGSPGRYAGYPMAGGVDYAGNPVPSTPDIGALQHTDTNGPQPAADSITADAFVRNGTYAGDNYGSDTLLTVKSDALSYDRKAYLRSALPGTLVTSATLHVFVTGEASARTLSVYTTDTANWLENAIDWNNAPMDTLFADSLRVASTGPYAVDVTAAVNRAVRNQDTLISFVVMDNGAASSTATININSREATTGHPYLVLLPAVVNMVSTGPLADAYVRDGAYAGNNYGSDTVLTVKADATSYNRHTYLKFGLTGYKGISVGTAALHLYASVVAATRTVSLYTTHTTAWTETGLTWNNAPLDTTYIASFTVSATGPYTIDVTSAINTLLAAGDTNVSFLLKDNGTFASNATIDFSSREEGVHAPVLTLSPDTGASLASAGTWDAAVGAASAGPLASGAPLVRAFPNPVQGSCMLQSSEPMREIRLYDLQGRLVRVAAGQDTRMYRLDMDELPVGVYFLTVNGQVPAGGGRLVKKP